MQTSNIQKPDKKSSFWDPHTVIRPSILSSASKEQTSYKGLLNVAVLLLIISNFRELMIENFMHFGVLVDFSIFGHMLHPYEWPGVLIALTLNVYIIFALLIEKYAFSKNVFDPIIMLLHGANLIALLVTPAVMVKIMKPVFVSGLLVSLFTSTLWLKLYSYAHTNLNLRSAYNSRTSTQVKDADNSSTSTEQVKEARKYPDNLNFQNIYYFISIPTLCYQLNYPRTERIRFRYLIRKAGIGILLSGVVFIIGHQYLYPHIVDSLVQFDTSNYIKVAENLLKVSIPNLYLWLLGFYVLFDIYLNVLGEITRFGDRKFYGDWWNAQSLGHYWRNWNLPVHNWMVRHIYTPWIKYTGSKTFCLFISFFISAFFHEYVLSIPFGQAKLWAFFGILAQVPLVFITEQTKDHHYTGNLIFWFSIVLGQPLIVLLYYRDYVKSDIIQ